MLEKKNYLSKAKWEDTCLLHQTWGKENDTWWKVGTWRFAEKIGRKLILIILIGFSNFSIFPFFIKRRRFIVAVCFSFSINNSNLLELRDFQDISGSQHLLNSVYVRNTGEPSACFFSWLFCRLILNFWFCFYTVPDSSLVLLYLLYLLFNSMLQCMKLIEGCWCFLSTH